MLEPLPRAAALADLDESIRTLLRRELSTAGLEVDVVFDAPNREWATTLSSPTLNAFLYDLRQSKDHRPVEWAVEKSDGRTTETRPPLMLEATYAVTAWTRAVEDEHRLLSQVIAILNAYPQLPEDVLSGSLVDQLYPLSTKIAQPKADGKADFWSSIGGTYKVSLDYSATVAVPSGMKLERGPQVKSQTVRIRQKDGPPGNVIELHRAGGTVKAADGSPVAEAWIVLPDAGRWASSDQDGQFRFDRLSPGTFDCLARSPDGREVRGLLVVPGSGAELTFGAPGRSRRAN
jgi:hypothetical protein